ncbi:hypothetical protein IE53DRAFT_382171 [Violaceomyces palustris]|uniref:Uncharacterized protein n=1 Tax=Violaceomyces palustris TaxID=1673888 RepID=A0ACD0NNF7_9BASI|nr:hypothetical protein IE53DRAFT_382171 [Violaceomyces palustris]
MTDRAGNKGAGVAGYSEANADRRERLRKLAMETIDINKDPYILRNHLGGLECRLCLTLHTNEGSYLAHTQGKKHQTNLARRAAREAKESAHYNSNHLITAGKAAPEAPKKSFIKIGRPGYKITKIREPIIQAVSSDGQQAHSDAVVGGRMGLLFQIHLPQIKEDVIPLHRFMSSFEQRQEMPNRAWQYLVVAAEPYETIAFKLQSKEVDRSQSLLLSSLPNARPKDEPGTWSHWDPDAKSYTIQVLFR